MPFTMSSTLTLLSVGFSFSMSSLSFSASLLLISSSMAFRNSLDGLIFSCFIFSLSSWGIFVETVTDLLKFSPLGNTNWENKRFT